MTSIYATHVMQPVSLISYEVPRSTQKGHHLIRCLAPEKAYGKASPTEQRLTSIEGRLDGMQTQLNDLTGHVGDLTDRVGDLNARLGNIEQLLQRLVGAHEGYAA